MIKRDPSEMLMARVLRKRVHATSAAISSSASSVQQQQQLLPDGSGAGKRSVSSSRAKRTRVKTEATPEQLTSSSEPWEQLCSVQELSCELTLASGQVFSWRKHATRPEWTGVIGQRVFALRERENSVEFRCLHPPQIPQQEALDVLIPYFRLETDALELYRQWTETGDRMAKIIAQLPGLRIIRQDPVECLFAFICSSNNNIQRIQQMVDKLKATYGSLLYTDDASAAASAADADGKKKKKATPSAAHQPHEFYAFPSVETLAAKAEDATLRSLGFGYRAPFVIKTSQQLLALGGTSYLEQIRDSPALTDSEYQNKLMVFAGVGRKVADCVGLFSLEKLEAIPVDTHVWQIACREFDPTLEGVKSLTPGIYARVGSHFRTRFAPYAGWAHSVLFAGDLTSLQSLLPSSMQKKTTPKTKKVRPSRNQPPSHVELERIRMTSKPRE